jgi:mRNA interferase MazF
MTTDPPEIGRGDVVWADLSPSAGREQAGHRPYLVLSDPRFHRSRALVIAVPMTTKERPWPTRVQLGPSSFAIAEQPRTFAMSRITRIDPTGYDVAPVRAIINRLIGGR